MRLRRSKHPTCQHKFLISSTAIQQLANYGEERAEGEHNRGGGGGGGVESQCSSGFLLEKMFLFSCCSY